MTSNNRFLILTSVVLSIVLFFFLQDEATLQAKLTPSSSSNNNMEKSLRFTILHTSDLHSQFQGVGPDTIYHEARGHFARLKYAITSLQNKLNPFATLTVDAGDWNSGTLFHLIQVSYMYPDLVPEFQFLSDSLYDATVLGNHEFDGNEEGLSYMIQKANRNGIQLPILSSNIYFDEGCKLRDDYHENCNVSYVPTRAAQQLLGKRVNDCNIAEHDSPTNGVYLTPYILRELKASASSERVVKVAVLGVFSINAAQTSAVSRKCTHFYGSHPSENFSELVKSIRDRISEIKSKHEPDVIVLLNHSGEDEDERIIRSLQRWDKRAVDVHISSHTHSVYVKRIGQTVLAQAGPYGINLGALQFSFDYETKQLVLLNELEPTPEYFQIDSGLSQHGHVLPPRIPINAATLYDQEMLQKITLYKKIIDKTFLSEMGFSYDTKLGVLHKKPSSILEVSHLVADALLEEINLELKNHSDHCGHNNTHTPVDFVMIPPAGVRVEFFAENGTSLQFSDMFRIMGIGALNPNITASHSSGIRLAHFYLSKRQVRQTILNTEIAARFINEMMCFAYSSTLQYRFRKFGIPFYNLLDISIRNVSIDDLDRDLVHVACPSYAASYLKLTKKMSKGILSFDMKDRFGRAIDQPFLSDYPDYIYLARQLQKLQN